MVHYYEIKRIQSELLKRKEYLVDELSQLPEGHFFSYNSKGHTYYAERFPAAGNVKKERRVVVRKNTERLFGLVRKKYVTKAIKLIDKDLDVVAALLKSYKPSDENSVMQDFIDKHPDLTNGIYYGQVSSKQWADEFESENDFHQDSLKSVAADGSMRRSLGEVVIGSRLDYYGIPYRYEAPINHPDISYIPDFTISRPRDGKIIYWEHLGRVNDREYLNYNKQKFDFYENYGIVPWDNLIVSYSQSDYGINEKLIDGLIQGWLL